MNSKRDYIIEIIDEPTGMASPLNENKSYISKDLSKGEDSFIIKAVTIKTTVVQTMFLISSVTASKVITLLAGSVMSTIRWFGRRLMFEWRQIGRFLRNAFGRIGRITRPTRARMGRFFRPFFNRLRNMFSRINRIKGFFREKFRNIRGSFGGILNSIIEGDPSGRMKRIVEAPGKIFRRGAAAFSSANKVIKRIISGTGTGIGMLDPRPLARATGSLIGSKVKPIVDYAVKTVESIKSGLDSVLISKIKNTINTMSAGLKTFTQSIKSLLNNAFTKAYDSFVRMGANVLRSIGNRLSSLKLVQRAAGVASGIADRARWLRSMHRQTHIPLKDALLNDLKGTAFWKRLAPSASAAMASSKKALGKISKKTSGFVETIRRWPLLNLILAGLYVPDSMNHAQQSMSEDFHSKGRAHTASGIGTAAMFATDTGVGVAALGAFAGIVAATIFSAPATLSFSAIPGAMAGAGVLYWGFGGGGRESPGEKVRNWFSGFAHNMMDRMFGEEDKDHFYIDYSQIEQSMEDNFAKIGVSIDNFQRDRFGEHFDKYLEELFATSMGIIKQKDGSLAMSDEFISRYVGDVTGALIENDIISIGVEMEFDTEPEDISGEQLPPPTPKEIKGGAIHNSRATLHTYLRNKKNTHGDFITETVLPIYEEMNDELDFRLWVQRHEEDRWYDIERYREVMESISHHRITLREYYENPHAYRVPRRRERRQHQPAITRDGTATFRGSFAGGSVTTNSSANLNARWVGGNNTTQANLNARFL